MTKSTVVALLAILVVTAAFSPLHHNVAFQRASRLQPLFMFSADDSSSSEGAKALETLEANALEVDIGKEEAPKKKVPTFKNLSTGKVMELNVDVRADTTVSPFKLSWWAYGLVVYPFVLLADDAFHFLPSGDMWDNFKL